MTTMKAEIGPQRLGHLNLFVSDLERSGRFYTNVCGFEEVFREPGISMIFLSNGNSHHDIGLMEITKGERIGKDGHVQVRVGQGKSPGLNHLGFEMRTEAELVAAWRRAKAAEMRVYRTTDHIISHSIYLTELNGHRFEFYADMTEDWRKIYAENAGALITGDWDPDAAKPLTEQQWKGATEFYRHGEALAARNVAYAGLPVRDLDASIAYYTGMLGMQVTFRDSTRDYAVLGGKAGTGCDLVLRRCAENPPARLLFGGVQMHDGQPVAKGAAWLRSQGVPSALIGDAEEGAVIMIDPDGIPLVYSTGSALALMTRHGPAIFATIADLSAAR